MKIFDCFTFYNEFDILEIRLHELYPIVDHFVVVEATKTYAGRDKPLHFADNRERFAAYADKIIHVVVDDLPAEASDHWAREYAQRNGIERGLTLAAPGDLVIVSDVDEIIRREVIEKIRATGTAPAVLGFRLRVYSMRFNYQNILGPEAHIVWPVAMRRDQLTSPQEARNSRFDLDRANDGSVIDDAGWHYTSVGNDEWIRNKIANFSHSEFHDPAFITQVNPNQLLARGLDLFGRNGRNIFEGKDFIWAIVPPPAAGARATGTLRKIFCSRAGGCAGKGLPADADRRRQQFSPTLRMDLH